MIILGIDPGLQRTGWGIIEASHNRLRYVDCGTITPDTKLAMAERLHHLHQELTKVMEKYQPGECAIEETFVNSNAGSSLKLGQARGAIMLSVAMRGIPIFEYAATLIKKSVVGVGRAEKHQVQMMMKLLLPGCDVSSADAADSLATAICHNSHRKMS